MITIKEHAVLICLFGKYMITLADKAGENAYIKAIERIGYERGARMSKKAILHSDELNYLNYCAYSEWKGIPGTAVSCNFVENGKVYQEVTKCYWNTVFCEFDLLEYGRYYCHCIDKALYQGFNSDLKLDVISTLSDGDDCCLFDWNEQAQESIVDEIAKKKALFQDKYIRDFDYHCHQVYLIMKDVLDCQLPDQKEEVVNLVQSDFEKYFSKEQWYEIINYK